MKIIPLHSAEPTFLKLSKIEWGISALFALLIPLFMQSILALLGYFTSLPLLLSVLLVVGVDMLIVYAKSKEQDFFSTVLSNHKIPGVVRGIFPATLTERPIPGGLDRLTPLRYPHDNQSQDAERSGSGPRRR